MSEYMKCYSPTDSPNTEFGDGYYKTIIETDQITCGELHVPPHAKAGYDSGHDGADEIFYVVNGVATVYFPHKNESVEVPAGSYIMMPRSLAHEVSNNTDEYLLLTFQCVKR
jgi:mannose-6-phosphate isomerase-like protein (cupin superfamily)